MPKKYVIEKPNVHFITDQKGHKEFVVIALDDYETLLEDMQDLALMASRKDDEYVGFDDVKKRLKKNGKV